METQKPAVNLETFNQAMKTTYAYLKSEAPLYLPDGWVRIERKTESGILIERISPCDEPPDWPMPFALSHDAGNWAASW